MPTKRDKLLEIASLNAQEIASANAQPPVAAQSIRTRRHAVWLGAIVFAAITLAIFLAGYVYATICTDTSHPAFWSQGWESGPRWRLMARSFAACFPLSILLGMLAGFDAYRFAAGARMLVGPIVLLAFTVPFLSAKAGIASGVLVGVLLFSAMQFLHRLLAAVFFEIPLMGFRLLYLALLILCIAEETRSRGLHKLHDALSFCAIFGAFLSDAIVTGWIRKWARNGRIDVENGRRTQFSLRTLLAVFVLWTLYLTLLATMFSDKIR